MSPSDPLVPPQLFSIDPVTRAAAARITRRAHCDCLAARTKSGRPSVPTLHCEAQDHSVSAWKRVVELVNECERAQSTVFEPSAHMSWDDWLEVTTLPASLGRLAAVKQVRLYGSPLRRLPPEIGRMAALEELDIYTSYAFHWLPYEITRCANLRQSRMSTRALYGNIKTGLPFPRLAGPIETVLPLTCSVCDTPFNGARPQLFWITLRVGTDVVPLLVHSCSKDCTLSLPKPPPCYHPRPHRGGGGVGMPKT